MVFFFNLQNLSSDQKVKTVSSCAFEVVREGGTNVLKPQRHIANTYIGVNTFICHIQYLFYLCIIRCIQILKSSIGYWFSSSKTEWKTKRKRIFIVILIKTPLYGVYADIERVKQRVLYVCNKYICILYRYTKCRKGREISFALH